ncbi:hypothetical protein AeNC1_009821 [Aphanomyces euteiches]|nr:hypothetical protein AeNC1_009821 [Aphanomyces euteiches]
MKATVFLLSTLATAALARRTAYTTLSDDDQAQIKMELTKWKTLYGELANSHGYVPASSTESVGLVDTHSAEELARFHNTLQDVAEAQKNNPNAVFSPFNMFALLTQAEFDKVLKNSFAGQNFNASAPVASTEDATTVASAVDWSTDKCNSPVRNQGQCGSCWAFSTIAAAEFANCLGTGTLLDLSEQQVTSCETQSMGCNGGYPTAAIDFESQGVCLEADYPYNAGTSGQTGSCQTSCTKQKLAIGKTIQATGESALISALNTQPVVVTVASGNSVWRNYKGGVVTQCPNARSDHAVLAVGYGSSDKGDYFKIKNSWGAQWGDNGYIYLQRGVASPGMCNVVENIAYPQITGSSAPKPPSPSTSAPTPTQPPSVPTPDPTRRTKKPTSAPVPSSTPTFAPITDAPTTVSPGDDETPSPTDASTPFPTDSETPIPTSDPSTPSPSDYTPSPTIRTRRPRPTNKPRPTWTWPWPMKTKSPTMPPRDFNTPSPTDFLTPDTPSPADLTPETTSPGDFTPSTPSPDDEYTPSPTDFSPSTPTPSDFTPSPSDFTVSPSEVPSTPAVPATTKNHKCKTRKPRTRTPCTRTPSPATLSPDTPAPFPTLPDTESPETPAPFTTESPNVDTPSTTLPDTDSPETTAPDTESPVTEYPETTAPITTSLPETETPAPVTDAPTSRPTRKPRSPRPTFTRSPTIAPTADPTPSPSTTSPAPAPGPSSSGMQGQLVDQTNKIRAAHGLGPVTWDADLAAKMQAYADSCPGFNHGGPEGWQNLATNEPCSGDACLKIVGAAWMWYNQEETKWNYNANKCNGDWSTCGHFSNMMSPGVKQIACGWSQCSNGNYVWCNYESSEMNPAVPRISGMTKEQLKATLAA